MSDSKPSSAGKAASSKKPAAKPAAKASTPPPVPPTPPAPPMPPVPPAPPAPPAPAAAPAAPPPGYAVPAPGYAVVVPLRPDEERNLSMLAHLISLLVNLVGGGWIVALVFYLVYKDRGAFVRAHTATELNFQLTLILGIIAGYILSLVLIGILVFLALPVLAIVFGIIATMKANRGEWYVYPIAIRFVH
ncbi:MAG: hypothetical protein JWP32_2091 [Schumannella sp.]|nr:hypothetical protein [Schumannella sp.]